MQRLQFLLSSNCTSVIYRTLPLPSVPTPAGFGIDPAVWDAKLDLMADQALASGSPANNPRVPDKAEIIALYRAVWAANS